MLRWNKDIGRSEECPSADAFLKDIIEVYKKHNLALSHEDFQGSFIICPFSENKVTWLEQATVTSQKD